MVWVGTFGDPLAAVPGIWERCQSCGAKTQPIEVHLAPSLGTVHGPAVPTPEDILRSAGELNLTTL